MLPAAPGGGASPGLDGTACSVPERDLRTEGSRSAPGQREKARLTCVRGGGQTTEDEERGDGDHPVRSARSLACDCGDRSRRLIAKAATYPGD